MDYKLLLIFIPVGLFCGIIAFFIGYLIVELIKRKRKVPLTEKEIKEKKKTRQEIKMVSLLFVIWILFLVVPLIGVYPNHLMDFIGMIVEIFIFVWFFVGLFVIGAIYLFLPNKIKKVIEGE